MDSYWFFSCCIVPTLSWREHYWRCDFFESITRDQFVYIAPFIQHSMNLPEKTISTSIINAYWYPFWNWTAKQSIDINISCLIIIRWLWCSFDRRLRIIGDCIVRSRIEPSLKIKANRVLNEMGISMSDALRLFLKQVVVTKSLPFQIKLPNAETIKAMEAADRGEQMVSTMDIIAISRGESVRRQLWCCPLHTSTGWC